MTATVASKDRQLLLKLWQGSKVPLENATIDYMPGTTCILDLTATLQYVLIVRIIYACYFITKVSSHGTWPLLEEIQDPELKGLADKLPKTVLKSRADSTTKKYLGAFRKWKQWALKHGAKSFPVDGKYLRSSVSPIYWRDQWL